MIFLEITNIHTHPIWYNTFFYLFLASTLLLIGVTWFTWQSLKNKNIESNVLQQQHVARIDNIRKDHSDNLESLRVEMLKREEDRVRQWVESEKETLHVLNGVSTLLELSDKVDKVEFKKLNNAITEIKQIIIDNHE